MICACPGCPACRPPLGGTCSNADGNYHVEGLGWRCGCCVDRVPLYRAQPAARQVQAQRAAPEPQRSLWGRR